MVLAALGVDDCSFLPFAVVLSEWQNFFRLGVPMKMKVILAATFLAVFSVAAQASECPHKKGSWSGKLCDPGACISITLRITQVAKDCKSAQVSTTTKHTKFPRSPGTYKGIAKISGNKVIAGKGTKNMTFTRVARGYDTNFAPFPGTWQLR
jgi:hypothetical protein